jgi:hypothetical protein
VNEPVVRSEAGVPDSRLRSQKSCGYHFQSSRISRLITAASGHPPDCSLIMQSAASIPMSSCDFWSLPATCGVQATCSIWNKGLAGGAQAGSAVRLLLMIVGNLWLLAAVALLLGKTVARTQPVMYSFFDIGAWLYPSTYNVIVMFCGLLSLGFFAFAWRGRPGHAVSPRRKQLPSDPSLQPTAQFTAGKGEQSLSSTMPRYSRKALLGAVLLHHSAAVDDALHFCRTGTIFDGSVGAGCVSKR